VSAKSNAARHGIAAAVARSADSRFSIAGRPLLVITQTPALHEFSQYGYGNLLRRNRTNVNARGRINGIDRRRESAGQLPRL
jgi:hypothetical protein